MHGRSLKHSLESALSTVRRPAPKMSLRAPPLHIETAAIFRFNPAVLMPPPTFELWAVRSAAVRWLLEAGSWKKDIFFISITCATTTIKEKKNTIAQGTSTLVSSRDIALRARVGEENEVARVRYLPGSIFHKRS